MHHIDITQFCVIHDLNTVTYLHTVQHL